MARVLALCALVGVVSAASYPSPTANCPAKKYNVEGNVKDPFLTAADANGKNGGFIIDFLELLKSSSNGTFDYKLTQSSYANPDYQLLINDLAAKKFDMIAADVTVRSERQDMVDFLQPYLTSKVRILTNNNPTNDANFEHAVVGYNPTWYVEDDVSVKDLLQHTKNATLRAAYQSAVAGNRVVDVNTGAEAVQSSNSPAALIGTTPILSILNGQSTATGLTDDVLETVFFALAIQPNQNAQRLCLNKLQLLVQQNGSLQLLINKYNLNW